MPGETMLSAAKSLLAVFLQQPLHLFGDFWKLLQKVFCFTRIFEYVVQLRFIANVLEVITPDGHKAKRVLHNNIWPFGIFLPSIAAKEASRSTCEISASETPGFTLPGQRTMKGTRVPPSYI